KRQREKAMSDRRFERRFTMRALNIHMDPLMIECGIGKLLDAFLRDVEPVCDCDFLADESFESFGRIEGAFGHRSKPTTEAQRHRELPEMPKIAEIEDTLDNRSVLPSFSPCLRATVDVIFSSPTPDECSRYPTNTFCAVLS